MRALIFLLLTGAAVHAVDWPQFLGPARNGSTTETNLGVVWPKEGPRTLWKAKVGEGWSGPVVASNRVFVFHRAEDKETLDCLSAANGERLWRADYPATYRDDFGFEAGPRSTPAVDGEWIYTFGADGVLSAWNTSTGAMLWQVETRKKFGTDKGFFGIACSPLVEGNAVILNIGGEGAGIVAFNKATGEVLWKATSDEASYSSPVVRASGNRRLFVFSRHRLTMLEPADGRVLWEFPWKPRISASVSAATPLVIGDQVFITASYGAGAALLRLPSADTKPQVIWSGDDILSSHYPTPVHHNGFLYGFEGRQEQRCHLRCVELKTGQVRWSQDRFGAGSITLAGDRLLILTERGELISAPASSEKFTPQMRAQILGSDIRAHPALAHGLFYARDKAALVCVDLRPEAGAH